jgi:hypothetical protein
MCNLCVLKPKINNNDIYEKFIHRTEPKSLDKK